MGHILAFPKGKARFIVEYPFFGVYLVSLNADILVMHCWHEDYSLMLCPSQGAPLQRHLTFCLLDGDVTIAWVKMCP